VRRGIIGYIADFFELTKALSDTAQSKLPLNRMFIKRFRDTASHHYGTITNYTAHACLMHCIDKKIMQAIKEIAGQARNDITD